MEIEPLLCPVRGGTVRFAPGASAEGVVCLDCGDACPASLCPVAGIPVPEMALRLARSGLADPPLPTLRMRCDACGETADLAVVDRTTLLCPLCDGLSRWIVLRLVSRWIAIGRLEPRDID